MKSWHKVAITILLLAVLGLLAVALRGGGQVGMAGRAMEPERKWPPLDHPVVVEVYNGGGSRGAALEAVRKLRRAGLDVVQWGNAPSAMRDTARSTHRVLIRRGDSSGYGRIVEALGETELIDAPDNTRLVDLTVIVARRSAADSS